MTRKYIHPQQTAPVHVHDLAPWHFYLNPLTGLDIWVCKSSSLKHSSIRVIRHELVQSQLRDPHFEPEVHRFWVSQKSRTSEQMGHYCRRSTCLWSVAVCVCVCVCVSVCV